MRGVIEQDICATCAHLRPSQPLPADKTKPPFGVFDIQCDCAEGWPYTGVFASANARSECPKFSSPYGVTGTGHQTFSHHPPMDESKS